MSEPWYQSQLFTIEEACNDVRAGWFCRGIMCRVPLPPRDTKKVFPPSFEYMRRTPNWEEKMNKTIRDTAVEVAGNIGFGSHRGYVEFSRSKLHKLCEERLIKELAVPIAMQKLANTWKHNYYKPGGKGSESAIARLETTRNPLLDD